MADIKSLYVPYRLHDEVKKLAVESGLNLQETAARVVSCGLDAIKKSKKTKPAKQ